MRLLPLTRDHVGAVARAMRAADRAEIYATRRDEDWRALAEDAVGFSRLGAVAAAADGTPVVAAGGVECWPGLWQVWMFATPRWPEVALGMTRWARRHFAPALVAAGAHRAECRSLAGNLAAHRWLAALGAVAEACQEDYGRNRESFITFAWRRPHVHVQRAETTQAAGAAADRSELR